MVLMMVFLLANCFKLVNLIDLDSPEPPVDHPHAQPETPAILNGNPNMDLTTLERNQPFIQQNADAYHSVQGPPPPECNCLFIDGVIL